MKDISDRLSDTFSPSDIVSVGQLRFLTCGSVDDGKSTLIGRLLYDASLVFDDHLHALDRDSKAHGTTGDDIDVALLLDGLEAEREQGITIDVAHRYFRTPRRRFIVADTPGHEQYTRNMVTGASTSELAVLLIDARKGLLTQTRRHALVVALLGIKHIVVAVNKIDLVDYDKGTFDSIEQSIREFAARFEFRTLVVIPTCARRGDNVTRKSVNTPWYRGPTLLEHLETIEIAPEAIGAFRLPVQSVNRANADFRGYAGTVAAGRIKQGETVLVGRSGLESTVERIVTFDGDSASAVAGDSITLTISDEIDISRGDVLHGKDDRPSLADAFAADLIWLSEAPMLPGRSYLLQCGTCTAGAIITEIKYRIDLDSLGHIATKELNLNEIGFVNVSLTEPIALDSYEKCRTTGSFIIIDRQSNATIGAGMIRFPLRRGMNLVWQNFDVSKATRALTKGQKPAVLWFTGLSGAGKSAVANIVEKKLTALGKHTFVLDGDNLRHGLNKDLGFTDADRVENIRRAAEVSKLFVESGLITLVSFISPFKAERQMARALFAADEFIEVYVDAPLEVCERRDPKGLYRRARSGALKNFTGIDSPYEAPESPEIHLNSSAKDVEALSEQVLSYLIQHHYLA